MMPDFIASPDLRPVFLGISHPPMKNVPGLFNWVRCRSATDALTKALDEQLAGITENAIREKLATTRTTPILYHPADRDLLIFDMEPELSAVARFYDRNLIILSPRVETEDQWDRIWDTTSRIAIMLRYSTGEQGDLKPVILGCLPDYGRASDRQGRWFILRPQDSHKESWENFWSRYVLLRQSQGCADRL
jgi:hypothetical protein